MINTKTVVALATITLLTGCTPMPTLPIESPPPPATPATSTPSPTPTPSARPTVTAGAYCDHEGTSGVTTTGTPMVCKRTTTDPKPRWRKP